MPKNYTLDLRKRMKSLGVYREEYEAALAVLARLMRQYDALNGQFEAQGMPFEVQTSMGSKKAPIVTTLEALRRDILAYMSALGLTPAGARRLGELPKEEDDPLSRALAKLDDGG